MMKIVVLTYGYPNKATPALCAFLKELVVQWKRIGADVAVINPVTIKNYLTCRKDTPKNEYFPLYFSYTFLKPFPFLRRIAYRLADRSFQRAAEKVLVSLKESNCFLYAHFLNAGYIAARVGKKMEMKTFCAFGESDLWSIKGKNIEDLKKYLNQINGFISVSSENTSVLLNNQFTNQNNILLAPNGVDLSAFGKQDKNECRKKLGLPTDKKTGIFVGHFIERKGPYRVAKATEGIPNLNMIYIGSGPQKPTDRNIVFCGQVKHEELCTYLGAADFFILPTKAEGCCNSILEAMACGLPIISSEGSFNDDILRPEYSIRIKAEDIEGMTEAIKTIINDEEKAEAMSRAAIVASKSFDIQYRARKILDFIHKQSYEILGEKE